MVSPVRVASAIGRNSKVAVLQPFYRRAAVRQRAIAGASAQDQITPSASFEDACNKLDEAVTLVDTLGCKVVLQEVVPLRSVNPKLLFGTGKVSEMSGIVNASNADAVFINAPLSGIQQKSLSDSWGGAVVLDRFRVILDIFADRARTTEAKLQVELAGLKYEAAHLVQSGAAGHLSGFDRQGGARGVMGGAGEKALEIQRRVLRDRMSEVSRSLREVEKRRGVQRRTRDRRLEPTVALVGYTNVGKSTLLNRLSLGSRSSGGKRGGSLPKGAVQAEDRVFDTLDPTSRSITLPSLARCVIVDTVGFIQDLPTALVHSFRATLQEVRSADVLLIIRDASLCPRISEAQRVAVEMTLRQLGATNVPTLEVWNKWDRSMDEGGKSEYEVEGKYNCGREEACNVLDNGLVGGRLGDHDNTDAAGTVGETAGVGRERTYGLLSTSGHTVDCAETFEGGQQLTRPRAASFRSREHKDEAVRISALTGSGIDQLLARVDAMLNLGGNARLAPRPVDVYRYVRVLPGQHLHK